VLHNSSLNPPRNSFVVIALEFFADLDVGVVLNASLVFFDELEIRRHHPTVGQISVEKIRGCPR
jgi:hypothetical protein